MSAAPDMTYCEVCGLEHSLLIHLNGDDYDLNPEVRKWCDSHLGPVQVCWRIVDAREHFKVNPPAEPTEVQVLCIGFSSDADAMAFKMRWHEGR